VGGGKRSSSVLMAGVRGRRLGAGRLELVRHGVQVRGGGPSPVVDVGNDDPERDMRADAAIPVDGDAVWTSSFIAPRTYSNPASRVPPDRRAIARARFVEAAFADAWSPAPPERETPSGP
jgi:hypothetical protein